MTTEQIIFAPLDRWLAYLASGWQFSGIVAEPMAGHHGAWAVLMWRPL